MLDARVEALDIYPCSPHYLTADRQLHQLDAHFDRDIEVWLKNISTCIIQASQNLLNKRRLCQYREALEDATGEGGKANAEFTKEHGLAPQHLARGSLGGKRRGSSIEVQSSTQRIRDCYENTPMLPRIFLTGLMRKFIQNGDLEAFNNSGLGFRITAAAGKVGNTSLMLQSQCS